MNATSQSPTKTVSTYPRCILVAMAKGGVGKTSVATNIAGIAAASGKKVLLVDLDPQGNCSLDLGYPAESGDELAMALMMKSAQPKILKDVRPGLDVIPGGSGLKKVIGAFSAAGDTLMHLREAFERILTPLAPQYDLILVDSPPGDSIIAAGVMGLAGWVLIPARADDASLAGTKEVALQFRDARAVNPALKAVGVVLFSIGSAYTQIEADVREQLTAMLGDAVPVLTSRIRTSEKSAQLARAQGRLIFELDAAARDESARRFEMIKKGEPSRYSSAVGGLSDDYFNLAVEVLSTVLAPVPAGGQ